MSTMSALSSQSNPSIDSNRQSRQLQALTLEKASRLDSRLVPLQRTLSASIRRDNQKRLREDLAPPSALLPTQRPKANSPTKLPDNICPLVTPSLDNAASLPVVNIYLEITGNLKPGAKVLVSSLENNIFPFAPVLVDETSTSPYIFFMPTVKLTEQALKADGNDPIKVLNSPSYYTEFLQRSSIEQSCKSLRNQLFDNVKHNINYIEKLFFPIGGKIMLPQMAPARERTQGYEYYRINSVSYKPMEPSYKLPNNKSIADPDSTRQTLITKLNKILRDIEEEPMPSLPQQEEIISEFNKNNNELEKLNNQVDNISKSITKNQDIINTLKPKIKKEKLEDSLQQSKNKDIYDSLLSENNIDTIDLGKYSTPLMKEYLNILKKIKKEKADRERVQKAAEDLQAKVIQNINQRKQLQEDTKKIQDQIIQKRQKLFKLQELINASKGGWLIDKGSNSDIDKGEWLTTKNGFAFPRVYNILFSIRVTPINDNETGQRLTVNTGSKMVRKKYAEYYNSNDEVVCISKVTHEIVKTVAPDVSSTYLPHAVNDNIFYKAKTAEQLEKVKEVKQRILGSTVNLKNPNKKIFFWNNRNARRKQSGTLVWWFKEFLDEVGHDQATLLMHTDAQDPHGQDLPHIINHLDIGDGQVLLSTSKVSPEDLAVMYNAADFTINIADAEGFGLGTLESLSCGSPIIVSMTGGLQEQVTDGKNWFGWGIKPASKAVIGSLQVPYIYEDRISKPCCKILFDRRRSIGAYKKAFY